jgi:hypothetical protein
VVWGLRILMSLVRRVAERDLTRCPSRRPALAERLCHGAALKRAGEIIPAVLRALFRAVARAIVSRCHAWRDVSLTVA